MIWSWGMEEVWKLPCKPYTLQEDSCLPHVAKNYMWKIHLSLWTSKQEKIQTRTNLYIKLSGRRKEKETDQNWKQRPFSNQLRKQDLEDSNASGMKDTDKTSVADPAPDPQNTCVFGPPGSGSISTRYGSGSFYNQAKIVRKTLIPAVLSFFMTFYLWKKM
jgi:hypothetical protein